ncbi:NAD-dependent epimerase/dehydratase family protein [soil metagenome]
MSRVFVTGGSGVVGLPIVKRLVSAGRDVRALARSHSSSEVLESIGAQPVRAELMQERALASAMAGCEIVFHVAGVNAFCRRDPSELYRVNVLGSLNVIRAAARAGARRVVYTSSAATLGEARGTIGHESSPHRGWFLSEYERSKFEAEQAVQALAARRGVELVSVNPSSVQGPGRAGGTGRILRLYVEGRLKMFVDTTLSLVDIDDCAEGHLLAESKGEPGRRYVLNGATLAATEALAIVSSISGVTRRPRLLPSSVALAAAAASEVAARIRGQEPSLCREMARTMIHGHAYDGSRAARELGLAYMPVGHTLRRTLEWLVQEGLVSRPARL